MQLDLPYMCSVLFDKFYSLMKFMLLKIVKLPCFIYYYETGFYGYFVI